MGTVTGAREGDWKCEGCDNRNYAFRSICNRCKQARLLVDSQTPADSKWLPRIGDWICPGCSNNNYASREKCNKCARPKASGTILHEGISVHNPVSPAGMALGLNMGLGMPLSMPNAYGMAWPWGSAGGGVMTEETPTHGNFRVGDWICTCGFHNYSSRLTCRQCQTPSAAHSATAILPPVQNFPFPGHGKRLATEDMGGDWAPKRLNMGGDFSSMHHQYFQQQQQLAYADLNGRGAFYPGQPLLPGLGVGMSGGPLQVSTSLQLPAALQMPISVLQPAILGKGAKQWRMGDWMCSSCSNHNFASRNSCNRCGKGKEAAEQSTSGS